MSENDLEKPVPDAAEQEIPVARNCPSTPTRPTRRNSTVRSGWTRMNTAKAATRQRITVRGAGLTFTGT